MKLFSSFDTKKKEKTTARYIQDFGEQNILVVSKSKIYWVLYILLPTLLYLSIETVIIYVLLELSWWWIFMYFIIIFAVIALVVFLWPIIKNYISYKMDFLIVTPISIIKYDQEWFFERDVKTINVQNLQTIRTKKSNRIRSIFNIGDILFIAESAEFGSGEWNIEIHYIYKPETIKHKILNITNKHVQKYNSN